MDGSQSDRPPRFFGRGVPRRAAIKAALGLGAAAVVGDQRARNVEAARRAAPTPTPIRCPGSQVPSDGKCVCPTGTKCGSDCCPSGVDCCDNACCYGTCVDEEICCSTGEIPCGKKCCGTGTRCVHDGCYDDPCKTLGEPCAANGDCCGFDIDAVCAPSESPHQNVCTRSGSV